MQLGCPGRLALWDMVPYSHGYLRRGTSKEAIHVPRRRHGPISPPSAVVVIVASVNREPRTPRTRDFMSQTNFSGRSGAEWASCFRNRPWFDGLDRRYGMMFDDA